MESEVLVSSSRIWRRVVLKTRQEFSTRLHGITSQKTTFLTVTKRALWCHFCYCVNNCSSLDPIHIQILSILRLPSFFVLSILSISFHLRVVLKAMLVVTSYKRLFCSQTGARLHLLIAFYLCVHGSRVLRNGWAGNEECEMVFLFFYFFLFFFFMVQSGGRRRSCVKMLSQSRKFVPSWRLLR
jgi:Uncharacterized membrane protein, required for N-linked glycosylation